MLTIFKKQKPKFYYPELNPSERIEKILLEYLLPELEPLGFKFKKSELSFIRTNGEFENEISFQKNKWNKGNEVCAFKPSLAIYSKELPKFLGITQEKKNIGFMGGYAEEIEGWGNNYFDGYYDLARHNNFDLIDALKYNLLTVGIKYFDEYKSYVAVVNYYLRNEERYFLSPSLFDICQMNNDIDKAVEILNWFEEFKNRTPKELNQNLINEIEIRKLKLKKRL